MKKHKANKEKQDIESGELIEKKISTEPDDSKEEKKPKKKLNPKVKFVIYFVLILALTGLALFLSLYKDFDGVTNAIKHSDWRYILAILGMVFAAQLLDALVLFIFVRLYTRKYHYPQAIATSLVGTFYSAVTPGASGGQVMQAYTLKKQGVEFSNGTSILIMSFIVYQIALIIYGIVSIFFQWNLISNMPPIHIKLGSWEFDMPVIPLIAIGFGLNVSVILFLLVMSYSRHIHNFIMNHGINLLAKMKLIKHPDKTRESLRVQIENFKLELKRLLSNIPIFLLVLFIFLLILTIRFSIPFFAGLALDGFGYLVEMDGTLKLGADGLPIMSTGQANFASFWNAASLSAYHQMVTGLIPLPGSAGISEVFFEQIFSNYFVSRQVTAAAQIIWRFMSFHTMLLISGIVSASYHAKNKDVRVAPDRKTFVTLQLETFNIRKATSDTLFETQSLSIKDIRKRLRLKDKDKESVTDFDEIDVSKNEPIEKTKKVTAKKPKAIRSRRKKEDVATKKKKDDDSDWTEIITGE